MSVRITFFGAAIVHGLALAALLEITQHRQGPAEYSAPHLIEVLIAKPVEPPSSAAQPPAPPDPIATIPDTPPSLPMASEPLSPSDDSLPQPGPVTAAADAPDSAAESPVSPQSEPPQNLVESPSPEAQVQRPATLEAEPSPPPVITPRPAPAQVTHSAPPKAVTQHALARTHTQLAAAIPARPTTQGSDTEQRQTDAFHRRIRDAVQAAVRCPAAARMLQQSGKAGVAFDYRDGAVSGTLQLVQSSGLPILDAAAVAAVRDAHYPEAPPEMLNHLLHLQVWVEAACGG